MTPSHFLFAFSVFDLAFLPMFHFFGIPFKLSFIFIIMYGVGMMIAVRKFRVTKVQLIFLLLLLALILSEVYRVEVWGVQSYQQFIRNLLTLIMCFFVFYSSTFQREIRFFRYLPLMYAFNNLPFTQWFYSYVPDIAVDFYFLRELFEKNYFSMRNAGIHGNANISALVAVLLFMLAFMETAKSNKWKDSIIIWVPTLLILFSFQSRGELLCFLVTSVFFFEWYKIRHFFKVVFGFVAIAMIFAGAYLSIPDFRILVDGSRLVSARTYADIEPLDGESKRAGGRIALILDSFDVTSRAAGPIGVGFDGYWNGYNEERFYFHNDYLILLTGLGYFGFGFYLYYIYCAYKIDRRLIMPFIVPALTNAFFFLPQAFILYNIVLARVIARRKMQNGALPPRS